MIGIARDSLVAEHKEPLSPETDSAGDEKREGVSLSTREDSDRVEREEVNRHGGGRGTFAGFSDVRRSVVTCTSVDATDGFSDCVTGLTGFIKGVVGGVKDPNGF